MPDSDPRSDTDSGAHPNFHAAADCDACPDAYALTCPDCDASLHFDPHAGPDSRPNLDPAAERG